MTIICLLLIAVIVPWSWSRGIFRLMFGRLWSGSTLRVGAIQAGKKLMSFKDVEMTKKNQEGNK